jgi:hypothetical protein
MLLEYYGLHEAIPSSTPFFLRTVRVQSQLKVSSLEIQNEHENETGPRIANFRIQVRLKMIPETGQQLLHFARTKNRRHDRAG